MANAQTPTREKALVLLGQSHSVSTVAAALGVTDSAISQLLADADFAQKVQELRFASLQKFSELDDDYNAIEEKLLVKLEKNLPLIQKPRDILSAIHVINGAKRRGQQVIDSTAMQSKVVQITIPQVIQQKFITNVNNQIVEVRDDEGNTDTLVTAQSGSLDTLVQLHKSKKLPKFAGSTITQERYSESTECERTSALANSL